jgi:hypothetical protein
MTDQDRAATDAALQMVFCACPALPACPGIPSLKPDVNCRGPVPDPLALLLRLQNGFPEPALKRAGLIEEHDSAGHLLAHGLYDCNGTVIGLARKSTESPFDLLTSYGTISGKLAILAILRDSYSRRMLKARPYLFATSSIHEVVMLRAMGFAATVSADLPRCKNFTQLRAASKYFSPEPGPLEINDDPIVTPADNWIPVTRGTQPAMAEKSTRPRTPKPVPQLVLVIMGWKLLSLRLEVPEGISALLRFFAELEDHLGLDLSEVQVWLPSEKFLADLNFATRFTDPQPLRALVLESVRMDTVYWNEPSERGRKLRDLLADQTANQSSPAKSPAQGQGS